MTDPTSQPPAQPAVAPELTSPVDQPEEVRKLVLEVDSKFEEWRNARRPHDVQWFPNGSMLRGKQRVVWNEGLAKLQEKPAAAHRSNLVVNRILPKIRARMAKFLKNRPMPTVVPASQDREDFLNARATQKVLEYIHRKQNLEAKYKEALGWSQVTGKGYWWVYWNPTATARVQRTNGIGGQTTEEVVDGDVAIEVGSPFEMLVSDHAKSSLRDQPEIMRVKFRLVDDVRVRYPDKAKAIEGEAPRSEVFQYERQLSNLSGGADSAAGGYKDPRGVGSEGTKGDFVLVKELFTKPCGKFPKGRYVVVAGGVLLKQVDELPYGFDNFDNPYPVVEFNDTDTAGQYWPTTHIEQMTGLQEDYNGLRRALQEHIRLLKHPKIFVPEQFRMPKNAWTTEAGEVIRYVAMPGIAPPTPWNPPPISSDVWRLLDTMRQEFDDVTNIYPAMQGAVGQATSGFQTNLLQEAADSVHAPDIRQHEQSLEDAWMKVRRLVAQGWDVPRLVSVTGRNFEPEVFEFSNDQIDENADIIIQSGSALSTSPAVRSQQVFELFNSGMLGDNKDPEVRRVALSLLSLNTQESMQEITHRDETLARLENLEISRGVEVEFPKPWENHNVHWTFHTDQLKSPDIRNWPPERRIALIAHVVMHAKFVNPQNAVSIAQEFGLTELIPLISPPPAPPAPAPQGPAPAPQGAPPPPPGQGPAAPPPPPPAPEAPPMAPPPDMAPAPPVEGPPPPLPVG